MNHEDNHGTLTPQVIPLYMHSEATMIETGSCHIVLDVTIIQSTVENPT